MGTTTEKLTYLNTTKQNLKTVINTTGAGLTDESTFRSYANVLNDKILGAINGDVDLFEEYPKVSGNGTDLSLNGVVEGKMTITPQGVSKQFSTNGYQLIDFGTLQPFPLNTTIITFEDNILTVSNPTAYAYARATTDITEIIKNNPNKSVRFGYDSLDKSERATVQLVIRYNDGTATKYISLLTNYFLIPDNTDVLSSVVIGVYSNNSGTSKVGNIVITKPILYFGDTKPEYETYTGGIPAPNPSYPYPVNNVTGENSLIISNSDNTETQNYSISLGNIELNSSPDGTIRDQIVGKPNEWYKREYISKVVLNGSESYGINSTGDGYISFTISNYINIIDKSIPNNLYSNMLKSATSGNIANTCRIASSGKVVISFKPDFCDYNSSALKEKLQTMYNNNNPLILYIPLAQYTDIPITDTTLINQLNDIYNNAHSYNGTTNITTTYEDGNEQMYLDIEALKNVWEVTE